jgi:hypothetical protein
MLLTNESGSYILECEKKKKSRTKSDFSGEQYEDTYMSAISWRMQKKSGTDEFDDSR